jgi:hypothetical protein
MMLMKHSKYAFTSDGLQKEMRKINFTSVNSILSKGKQPGFTFLFCINSEKK